MTFKRRLIERPTNVHAAQCNENVAGNRERHDVTFLPLVPPRVQVLHEFPLLICALQYELPQV